MASIPACAKASPIASNKAIEVMCGKLGVLALAALLAGCDYVRPFEQVCAKRLGPAGVRVDAPRTQQRHDFSQSASALTARGTHNAPAGRRVEGLTEIHLTHRISIGGSGMVKPFSGRYCTRPDVHVTLAFDPMMVFVASEQKPGTCAFDLTMNHELKHVRSYERFIDELAGEIEASLKGLVGDGIHYFPSAAEGERVLNSRIQDQVNASVRDGLAAVQKRQAAIDTPEEYDRLELMTSKCTP